MRGMTLPTDRFPTACRELEFGETKRRCWRALWQRWQNLTCEPLRVVAHLANGYIAPVDGGLHLDGILSAACFSLYPSVINPTADRYIIPLPLSLAWVSPIGDPLWLATELRPADEAKLGVAYLHARYPVDRADLAGRRAVLTSAGRYKDARLPLAVTVADRVEGWCIGDAGQVKRLLDRIDYIGRKSAHGFGRVIKWEIAAAPDVDPETILDRRAVPLDYLAEIGASVAATRLAPRLGWTPPYWHPASQGPVRTAAWTH